MDPRIATLAALRAAMRQRGLSACIIPSADEHLNEYLPPEAERRAFVSGFAGSAGDLLVTLDTASLFVDSRYHLQAEVDLQGSSILPVKLGEKDAKSLPETLAQLARNTPQQVGVASDHLSLASARRLARLLQEVGGSLVPLEASLVDALWTDRPKPKRARLLEVPLEWAGASIEDKLAAIRAAMADIDDAELILVRLDQIAWVTNLRSDSEIPFNPVFHAFARIGPKGLALYMDDPDGRLPVGFRERHPKVVLRPLAAWRQDLKSLGSRVCLDPDQVTWAVALSLQPDGPAPVERISPIDHLKSVKNEAERSAMRRANLLASQALTKALIWLRKALRAGTRVTEASFSEVLHQAYASIDGFRGLSFRTIAATGAHGAIVHYGSAGSDPLLPGELFLIDSGIHVAGGTTDATRTVPIGAVRPDDRFAYTLVLKGHIAGARQRFPEGTLGSAIDALVRAPLWQAGLDYGHGTGHGVGAWLNVHEGPFSISASRRLLSAHPLPLHGVTSIEPGFYRAGEAGIRLENLYLIARGEPASALLAFECLTFVPFEPRLIDRSLLQPDELSWLDAYQAHTAQLLQPGLDAEERAELARWLAGE